MARNNIFCDNVLCKFHSRRDCKKASVRIEVNGDPICTSFEEEYFVNTSATKKKRTFVFSKNNVRDKLKIPKKKRTEVIDDGI